MDRMWPPKWDLPLSIVLLLFLVFIWTIAIVSPLMWNAALREIGHENFDRMDKPPHLQLSCWTGFGPVFVTTFRRKNSTNDHNGCIFWDFSERKWILVPLDDD